MSSEHQSKRALTTGPGEGDEIFVVDDDERFARRLARAFESRGLRVRLAHGYDEALEEARRAPVAWAVLDLRLPDHSGLELTRELLVICPEARIVMLTGYGSITTAVDAGRLGAINYLAKPADADMVLAAFSHSDPSGASPTEADYQPPSLARTEWEHINRVLTDCGGNVSEAARRLGLHRRTLQRKLKVLPPQS
jgi:two-component system response regulator RegA